MRALTRNEGVPGSSPGVGFLPLQEFSGCRGLAVCLGREHHANTAALATARGGGLASTGQRSDTGVKVSDDGCSRIWFNA
jgi:hypothetical protein